MKRMRRIAPVVRIAGVVFMLAAVLAGCGPDGETRGIDAPGPVKVRSLFPAGMDAVNRIEMRKADGEWKTFYDKETIDSWIDRIGDLDVTVDADPEAAGALFQIGLYADGERMLLLSPRTVGGTPVEENGDLVEHMRQLWDGGDGRERAGWAERPSAMDLAALELEETFFRAHAGDGTTLHVKNTGPAAVHVGDGVIEQFDAKEQAWYRLPLPPVFSADASRLEPGNAFSRRIAVPAQLAAGQYRIVVEVRPAAETGAGPGPAEPVHLAAVFQIWRAE